MEYVKTRPLVSRNRGIGRPWMRATWLLLMVATMTPVQAPGDEPGTWVGGEVILRPEAKVPWLPATRSPRPFVRYRVENAEGDRLWLRSTSGEGWARAEDLIRIGDAIRFYTEILRNEPKAAWAYAQRGLVWSDRDEPEIAIADYSEALALDPKDAVTFDNRGLARLETKQDDKALADFDQALRLEPREPLFLDHRGLAYLAKKDDKRAISDFDEALRLDPKQASTYGHRGTALARSRQYGRAVADFEAALRLDPGDIWSGNALAWLLATCPDASLRDGAKAVELARAASKTAGEVDPYLLGTLAAAQAEAGDFDAAVASQLKALELFPTDDRDGAGHRDRLDLYRAKRPYHEGATRP
ncbi:tetratricopeptide repeat protein [Singulisphaera sp. PoT]|uniref:tetratricopeptide repeat protein n=1 Tax=Singulisphaera sp. PoT TaxID=3411797 RepID=UPI003BF5C39D